MSKVKILLKKFRANVQLVGLLRAFEFLPEVGTLEFGTVRNFEETEPQCCFVKHKHFVAYKNKLSDNTKNLNVPKIWVRLFSEFILGRVE